MMSAIYDIWQTIYPTNGGSWTAQLLGIVIANVRYEFS